MTDTAVAGLSRVTVVAGGRRIDLAIPTDLPMSYMLPTLLRYTGTDQSATGPGGWVLTRLGGARVDTGRSATQLGIRDGEILYLTPAGAEAALVAFDDVPDAIATAAQERTDRWTLTTTRRLSVLMASIALLGAAAAILFAGAPALLRGGLSFGLAIALVLTATIVSRLSDSRRGAVLFSLVALVYAAVGGLLIMGGDRSVGELGAPHVLLASASLLVFSTVLQVVTAGRTPLLLGTTFLGALASLGSGISLTFDISAAAVAAPAAVLALAWVPLLPRIAARLGGLPAPVIPAGAQDLKSDESTIDGAQILRKADRANSVLTALVGTTAAVLFAATLVVALTGGLIGALLGALLAVVTLLRGRPYQSRDQRGAMLVAGSASLGIGAVGIYVSSNTAIQLTAVVGGLVVLALIALTYGLGVAGRRIPPTWGRALDVVEILLILGVIPMAAWVCGLYDWIRSIQG
jgi:type VII secretion integral membrane protein EccD